MEVLGTVCTNSLIAATQSNKKDDFAQLWAGDNGTVIESIGTKIFPFFSSMHIARALRKKIVVGGYSFDDESNKVSTLVVFGSYRMNSSYIP